MAKKRIDVNIQSTGIAGMFSSGALYFARAYGKSRIIDALAATKGEHSCT